LLTSARPLSGYRAGTWGPMESEALLNRDQREWRNADE
jgi:glucose-6-phosphate 1-dehydrogenase